MDRSYYSQYLLDDMHSWELSERQKAMLDACIFLADNKCTIRCAASNSNISKSYLHYYIHKKLPCISYELYSVVLRVLKFNETKKIGGVNFGKYKHRN